MKAASSKGSSPAEFFRLGNVVLFTADNDLGTELWKTDGTDVEFVRDIAHAKLKERIDRGENFWLGCELATFYEEQWRGAVVNQVPVGVRK